MVSLDYTKFCFEEMTYSYVCNRYITLLGSEQETLCIIHLPDLYMFSFIRFPYLSLTYFIRLSWQAKCLFRKLLH